MDQHRAIKIIENIYPGDRDLLEQSKREVFGWRVKPIKVIVRYAELLKEKENYLRYRSLHG